MRLDYSSEAMDFFFSFDFVFTYVNLKYDAALCFRHCGHMRLAFRFLFCEKAKL